MLLARTTKHIYIYQTNYEFTRCSRLCDRLTPPQDGWQRKLGGGAAQRLCKPRLDLPKDSWVYNNFGAGAVVRLPVNYVPNVLAELDDLFVERAVPQAEDGCTPYDWYNANLVDKYLLWCLYKLRGMFTETDFSRVREDGWSFCSVGLKPFARTEMIDLAKVVDQAIASAHALEAGAEIATAAWNTAIRALAAALEPKRATLAVHFAQQKGVLL